MVSTAEHQFNKGFYSYTIAWLLLTFLGVFGFHRFYIRRYVTGVLFLLTGGLFFVGILYDFWNFNDTIARANTNYVK
jgi:TM2 domain-containing membrane protein YozV